VFQREVAACLITALSLALAATADDQDDNFEKRCAAGDGALCLALARVRSATNKLEEADRYYGKACEARIWEGCFGHATFLTGQAAKEESPERRAALLEQGLATIDRALELRPTLWEGMIYKGLLYRIAARSATSSEAMESLLEKASETQRKALEMKRAQGAAGDALLDYLWKPAPPPPPKRH